MDLFHLGLRDARTNRFESRVAISAMALAAMIFVLSHVIPSGYAKSLAKPERAFMGGDILVLPLGNPLKAGQGRELTWKPWNGSGWQSVVLDFLPGLETKGYVLEPDVSWRAFDPFDVMRVLDEIPGVFHALPYNSLPCVVEVMGLEFPAIIRGFDVDDSFFEELVISHKTTEHFSEDSSEHYDCLFPQRGLTANTAQLGDFVEITIPRPVVHENGVDIGLSWDAPSNAKLSVSGIYRIQVDLEPDQSQNPTGQAAALSPVYWERPEIIVSKDTFWELVQPEDYRVQLGPAAADNAAHFPTYQVSVKVDRMSQTKNVAKDIEDMLGPGFAAIPVPELKQMKSTGSHIRIADQKGKVAAGLLMFFLSSVIVAGSMYVTLAQKRRKIGLFKVVGATGRDIMGYVMAGLGYVALTGSLFGFLAGKALSILALWAADVTFLEWIKQLAVDFILVFGMSFIMPLFLGFMVGIWAVRIPAAEVLKRE